MRKQEFLNRLKHKLSGLPRQEINERISFFSEMIDDRVEDGYTEDEAVAIIGNTDDISKQIVLETKVSKHKRNRTAGEITLLAVGAPLWISLGIAALAVVLSIYVSLWAVIVSIWSAFASLAACGCAGVIASIPLAIAGNVPTALALLGASLACLGLSVFTFWGCRAATSGTLLLTKKVAQGMKKCFKKKEKI